MEQCLFCDTHSGQVQVVGGAIYQDELVYAHHSPSNDEPTYLGHLMLETKRHAPGFADLTPAEAQVVGSLITRLSKALKAVTGADKVYVVSYCEVVPHLHVHITARYPDTPPEYWRWNIEAWPNAPQGREHEISALCERLRAYLANEQEITS